MATFFQGEKMAAGKYSHPMAASGCLISAWCSYKLQLPMTDPWDWHIYPHEWLIFMVFMQVNIEHMGVS